MASELFVALVFHSTNAHPFEAVAVRTILLPTAYTPPPPVLPAAGGLAAVLTVVYGNVWMAMNMGWLKPLANAPRSAPVGLNFSMVPLPLFATYRLPLPSTAKPYA